MANDGKDGNRFLIIFIRIFEKVSGCQFSFKVHVWLEIIETLQKCCCSVHFLQEIALYHIVRDH